MRVKVILKIIKIVLILGVTYFIILGIQTIKIESNFFESPHGIVRMLEKYELVRCDWNIFNPEFALVMFTDEELGSVELYKFNKTFMNDEEIKNIESFFWLSYIPATFEELLEKVYSDCQYFENRNYELKEEELNELIKKFKTFEATEENLKKIEQVYREDGADEEFIKEMLERFKKEGEMTVIVNLDKIKLKKNN